MTRAFYALFASLLLVASAAPLRALAAPHDLTISNNASQAIEYVQISPPGDNQWGDDWLNSDEVIEPGNSRTFSITLGCSEDIRITFMDHTTKEYRNFDTCQYDLRVSGGGTS